ncbi:alginate lyase [Pseudozyma hubeiensis SY62]|uniref:Alginate lyase n=1 Tax=Pseudozyma hubeiensis (strain SY62) TaxID=1305764 RepID=R9P2V5_PSEHS|nr:alginate lyase [Pseudozyma hubeiensis SY62]GAC95629.1 alginate lyase [Pseudozyma hubeiensis SY62]
MSTQLAMMENHDLRPSTASFSLSPQHDYLVADEFKSLPSDLETHSSRRRRGCTRRKLLLLILLPITLLVLLFVVIFFPVYFTQHHSKTSSASPTGVFDQNATQARKARTTQGAVWQQARNFTDLNDFSIEYYSSGEANNKVLTGGLPSSALRQRRSSSGSSSTSTSRRQTRRQAPATNSGSSGTKSSSSPVAIITSDRSTSTPAYPILATQSSLPGSVLSIFYPANSYTPSAQPVGGTQFYALTPFDLTLASSITFNYSVFFPAGYNFVMGGKLPGLYGGTEGCGGGNDASDCWSTRMAWRTGGMGELYAYLPQDRQNLTAMLQVPPYSYVNSDYGISLGRGSFNYTIGGWTNISQTITLSTNKSHPNGTVDITVNNVRAIYYDQVYWPASIKGILFSTFFGGATKDWATPIDQYSYFKDFSVRINSLRNLTKT